MTEKFVAFDHIRFYVGNAKQAAYWYCANFGFRPFAYKGLETGSRQIAAHAIIQNKAIDDVTAIIEYAKRNGVTVVQDITEESDEHGIIKYSAIQTYGDTIHTLIERKNYKGLFLPGFKEHPQNPAFFDSLPSVGLDFVDHCVANQPANEMEPVVQWYKKMLQFHRFWSVDYSVVHAEYSSLTSTIVANAGETIIMAINEPFVGNKAISQIQEYVDYNGGAGVQHIGLSTKDIITTIKALKARGMEFLSIPNSYYDNLRERLQGAKISVKEDLDILQELKILVDFDDNGYLLQIFSKPCQDRPTLFIEIIQRNNHTGFGAGNFKALFESVEIEQNKRGNLFYEDVSEEAKKL
ncbi:hypothetical protein FO519_010124 [Halicephalobus sp. NKZ332]|nr:hypothetical protein FO519_010124 [Halicephalobus sp. NKZ332]